MCILYDGYGIGTYDGNFCTKNFVRRKHHSHVLSENSRASALQQHASEGFRNFRISLVITIYVVRETGSVLATDNPLSDNHCAPEVKTDIVTRKVQRNLRRELEVTERRGKPATPLQITLSTYLLVPTALDIAQR